MMHGQKNIKLWLRMFMDFSDVAVFHIRDKNAKG